VFLPLSKTSFYANITKVKLGVSDAQALSTIDALENTQPQLKVSPTGDVAVTAVRLDEFTLFRMLRPELRMKIWKEACFEPRIVEIEVHASEISDHYQPYQFSVPETPPPALMSTSAEARREGLKCYSRVFQRPNWHSLRNLPDPHIYMNFETDMAWIHTAKYLPPGCSTDNALKIGLTGYSVYGREVAAHIQRLALPVAAGHVAVRWYSTLKRFKGLKEITFLHSGDEEQGIPGQRCTEVRRGKHEPTLRLSKLSASERAQYGGNTKRLKTDYSVGYGVQRKPEGELSKQPLITTKRITKS
jgi:hypothetical protein